MRISWRDSWTVVETRNESAVIRRGVSDAAHGCDRPVPESFPPVVAQASMAAMIASCTAV